jgi:hypothetical protein
MASLGDDFHDVPPVDLEWMMHYQIPHENLHLHFFEGLESKESSLKRSKSFPSMRAGDGLFTTKNKKKGDLLCAFPGCWVEKKMWGQESTKPNRYAFTPPPGPEWIPMSGLVYATHNCQANLINSAVIGDEVLLHMCTPEPALLHIPEQYLCIHMVYAVPGAGDTECPL